MKISVFQLPKKRVKTTQPPLLVYAGKANAHGFYIVKKQKNTNPLSWQRMIFFPLLRRPSFRCEIVLRNYQNIHLGINNIVNI